MPESALMLDPQTRDRMVETKVTCPFLGSLVHQNLLTVRGTPDNPLAATDEVRLLGNEGGGDLGDLLVFFATGNHAFMRGSSGLALDAPVPAGQFSLELPGSQGSHPGHSGILQGDPKSLASGRLSLADFDRLASFAINGCLKRSDLGRFIAQNLRKDPNAKVAQAIVAELLARDLARAVQAISAKVVSMISTVGTGGDRGGTATWSRSSPGCWERTTSSAPPANSACSSHSCPMTRRQNSSMASRHWRSIMCEGCLSARSFRTDGRPGRNRASIGCCTRPPC